MTKWEYCTIGPLQRNLYPISQKQEDVCISLITSDGILESTIPEKEHDLSNYVAKLISHLGENGWELVGCGTCRAAANIRTALFGVQPGGVESHMLYFKRPIE